MMDLRAGAAMALVLVAALCGTIGVGLLYTALTDHMWGAVAWGLPLTLGGLYWCGRALAQGQRGMRQRRVRRALPDDRAASGQQCGSTTARAE